jgi:CNT family concentrative nucleoside transporter
MDLISLVRGIIGIVVLLGIAFLFSNNRKSINWKLVVSGLVLQIVFAILIVKGDALGSFFSPLAYPLYFFKWLSGLFVLLLNFTSEGANFVFGNLAKSPGSKDSLGMFFAFQVLPTIIFFASLTSILYYLGIMQK